MSDLRLERADAAAGRHPSALAAEQAARTRRQRRRVMLTSLGVSVAVLTALLAFGLTRDPRLLRSPLVGNPAPAFALRTLDDDGMIRLSDFRGQVVLINFWASWCRDCRVEHPHLLAAWERYRDQGVVFVGISFDDRRSAARGYRDELGGDWPLLWDPGSATAIEYGVFGVPETFFVGRDGRVAYKQVGPVNYELLTSQISRLLAGAEP